MFSEMAFLSAPSIISQASLRSNKVCRRVTGLSLGRSLSRLSSGPPIFMTIFARKIRCQPLVTLASFSLPLIQWVCHTVSNTPDISLSNQFFSQQCARAVFGSLIKLFSQAAGTRQTAQGAMWRARGLSTVHLGDQDRMIRTPSHSRVHATQWLTSVCIMRSFIHSFNVSF